MEIRPNRLSRSVARIQYNVKKKRYLPLADLHPSQSHRWLPGDCFRNQLVTTNFATEGGYHDSGRNRATRHS